MMASFIRVLRRELHIIAHNRFYFLFRLVLPCISFFILCATFYQEIPRDLPIVVCNRDHSATARELIRRADASPALKVAYITPDFPYSAQLVREGNAYAILYIPEQLEKDMLTAKPTAVVAYYNNQWMLTSSLIARSLREVIGSVAYQEEWMFRTAKGDSPNHISGLLSPIAIDAQPLFNPNLNYRFFLLPALLPSIMQAFVIMVSIRAFGSELKRGTVQEWLDKANRNYWIAILAKSFPYTLAFTVLSLLMLTILVYWGNVPFNGNLAFMIVANVFFILAYYSVGFAFVTLTANLRLANSLGGFYAGPAFAFAGITYPIIGMPWTAKIWSYSLPLTYYLKIFLEQAIRGAPTYVSFPNLLALCLFTFVPFILLAPRWKKFYSDTRYWGRL